MGHPFSRCPRAYREKAPTGGAAGGSEGPLPQWQKPAERNQAETPSGGAPASGASGGGEGSFPQGQKPVRRNQAENLSGVSEGSLPQRQRSARSQRESPGGGEVGQQEPRVPVSGVSVPDSAEGGGPLGCPCPAPRGVVRSPAVPPSSPPLCPQGQVSPVSSRPSSCSSFDGEERAEEEEMEVSVRGTQKRPKALSDEEGEVGWVAIRKKHSKKKK